MTKKHVNRARATQLARSGNGVLHADLPYGNRSLVPHADPPGGPFWDLDTLELRLKLGDGSPRREKA